MCKIERRVETPTVSRMQSLEVIKLADGSVELHLVDSSLKILGKGRWHTETILMTLDDTAKAELRAALA
jgi:hypothetical protein